MAFKTENKVFEVIKMLDKNRIRYMSRLAMYDRAQAKKDIRISGFYRKDYAGFNTLITAIELTFGYAVIAVIFFIYQIDSLLNNFTSEKLMGLLFLAAGGYLILIATYGVFVYNFYKKRHIEAKRRVREYFRRLSRLEKMSIKEKR